MAENFQNVKKETNPGRGITEGPKQDKPRQTHKKAYNQNSRS